MVLPYYSSISQLVPKLNGSVDVMKSNVETYKGLVDEYDEYMKDGNKMLWLVGYSSITLNSIKYWYKSYQVK